MASSVPDPRQISERLPWTRSRSILGPFVTLAVARRQIKAEQMHEAELTADVEDITRIAHAVLKREWERVKRGD